MHISEYVALRIAELQEMQRLYESNNEFDPDNWPVDMGEEDWFDQELAYISMEFGREPL